jgi:hypothetical protein
MCALLVGLPDVTASPSMISLPSRPGSMSSNPSTGLDVAGAGWRRG